MSRAPETVKKHGTIKHGTIKRHGVHYTPPELAAFLARRTAAACDFPNPTIRVLDPACGAGALLAAFTQSLPEAHHQQLELVGYERDADAAQSARSALDQLQNATVEIHERDFLEPGIENELFDVVIANPPYVRTQVLGAERAQALSQRFGIRGRVDLYHAFAMAMADAIKEGGVLGLLTSNRFLTIKSGQSLRKFLCENFDLRAVYDLGDTKLFGAAVLPAIIVAQKHVDQKTCTPSKTACSFGRVYEHRESTAENEPSTKFDSLIEAIQCRDFTGLASTAAGLYRVEKGSLRTHGNDQTWSLSTPENEAWLATIERSKHCVFDDVAHVRVGIKTTADAVFIQSDWESLAEDVRPEPELIRPLITHHDAARWRLTEPANRKSLTKKSVLYPHEMRDGARAAVSLDEYPMARAYFNSHAERLQSRKYITQSNRKWYEIWVPHAPDDWAHTKIVFPDIAEQPTFFLDRSAAVVNGDCYWMTLKPDIDEDWLYLILAVANSTFITKYYDVTVHNKLYAGRRRFMTQYVKQFPLPDLRTPLSNQIVDAVRELVNGGSARVQGDEFLTAEAQLDTKVWQAFGLSQPT